MKVESFKRAIEIKEELQDLSRIRKNSESKSECYIYMGSKELPDNLQEKVKAFLLAETTKMIDALEKEFNEL